MKDENLKTRFNGLYKELEGKGMTYVDKDGKVKNINIVAKGKMYRGLYGRNQQNILDELSKRKKPVRVKNGTISNHFDFIHHAITIMVFQEVLLEYDRHYDIVRGNVKGTFYWTELARDIAAGYNGLFRSITGKTPYQDLLVLIAGTEQQKEQRKEFIGKFEETLVKYYHHKFKRSQYEEQYPFGIGEPSIENIKINSENIPIKTEINQQGSQKMVQLRFTLDENNPYEECDIRINIKRKKKNDK